MEGITGGVNHGNGENESVWEYREGKNKQLRSPERAVGQQLPEKQSFQLSQASPELCLGRKHGCLQVQSTSTFPKAAQAPGGEGTCTVRNAGVVEAELSVLQTACSGLLPATPLKPRSNLARFCSRHVS